MALEQYSQSGSMFWKFCHGMNDSSAVIASEKQGMSLCLKKQKKSYRKEVLFIQFYRQETQTLQWLTRSLTGSLGGAGN